MTDVVDAPEAPEPDRPDPAGADDAVADDAAPSRGGRVGLIVSAVVALVALGFVAVLATSDPATERRSDSPLLGKVAPPLAGATLDGGTFDIDQHRDRWVVVNFFATWCGPCVEEHPELVAFDEAHRAAGDATLVSVVYDERPEVVADFFAERGGDWPVVAEGRLPAVDYGVVKVPETYLVAPGGVVVQRYTGGVTRQMIEDDMAAVNARLEELRAEEEGR